MAGYLGERLVRRRLHPSGWDAVETSLAVAGIGLAGAMAALGWQVERRDGTVVPPSRAGVGRRRGRGRAVREGSLYGGLPYLAVGQEEASTLTRASAATAAARRSAAPPVSVRRNWRSGVWSRRTHAVRSEK